jgi:ribosomal protein L37AE/L43A
MDNSPTWRDFHISQTFVDAIRNAGNNNLIGFLLNDRVFRNENKVNYDYQCYRCGATKTVTRQYEDYSACEKCRSESVHGEPFWKDSRSSKSGYGIDASRTIAQMSFNYTNYFDAIAENIVSIRWDSASFVAKFICGEEVYGYDPAITIAKAAILCPFLWDSNYNWRDHIHNDKGNDLHFSHLIMQWAI